jgi:hypothetical protein
MAKGEQHVSYPFGEANVVFDRRLLGYAAYKVFTKPACQPLAINLTIKFKEAMKAIGAADELAVAVMPVDRQVGQLS